MDVILQSPLSMFTYDDLHELHVFCGWVVVVLGGVLHTIYATPFVGLIRGTSTLCLIIGLVSLALLV